EIAARRREELNGLYVAMSRAKERLVFSATEPHLKPGAASWWQRIVPHALAWTPRSAEPAIVSAEARVSLAVLPSWHGAAARSAPAGDAANDAARLGQATHRVLEWAAAPGAAAPDLDALAAAAAQEFTADAAQVARLAARIWHSPQCERFFGGPALQWAGNEVPISHAGEVLRIDRLVALAEAGGRTWWVLDYKLQHAPQALAAYREQLLRYRSAVSALQPGDAVRCAFITGAGEVVEL
ncbi:MAG TPA: PD-(D/E)XK nuclease family protein, partial [Albitalea sp.]|nr:PD-(D/E)XK nuclease family protein [Albitalea sp.]